MSKRPFRLTRPIVREHPLQKQIADTLKIEIAPAGRVSRDGVVWFSIDFADFGGVAPGARVGRGVVAGPPDIVILWLGRAHWIEVKAEDGSLSDAQKSVITALLAAQCHIGVARDAAETLRCLDLWEIPRAHRTQGLAA